MTDVSNRSRQPKGAPAGIGGEFATETRPEVITTLTLRDRAALLASDAYVAPTAIVPVVSPQSTELREEWWNNEFVAAEYGHRDGSYAQMPDDYTPGGTRGQAMSGGRRTHRMKYSGAGVTVRMPSATSVKRFARENGNNTFDVPVSANTPLGDVAGWVRVTPGANGTFSVQGLGFPAGQEAYVAEAACAVLEGRRPSRALSEVGNLLARRRERAERVGTQIHPVRSMWIDGLGYDDTQNMMVMTTNGRHYGYHIDRATFETVATSASPGREYNHLVKKHAPRMAVERCTACGHFYSDASGHQCAVAEKPRSAELPTQNRHAAARVVSLAERRASAQAPAQVGPPPPPPPAAVLRGNVIAVPTPGRQVPFRAAGQTEALGLLQVLPEQSLSRSVRPGAPSTRTILETAARYPNEIAFAGQVRDDDVAVNGVYLFGHGDEALGYIYKRFENGFPGTGRPTSLTRVSVPSRPGQVAWLATW